MALNLDFLGSFGYSTTVADYCTTNGGSWSISMAGGRGGRAALRGQGQNSGIILPLKTSSGTKYFNIAIKPNWFYAGGAYSHLYFLRSGLENCHMRIDSSGGMLFYAGNTPITSTVAGVFTVAVWTHLQIKIVFHGTTGSIEVKINGSSTSALNATNINTALNGGAACDAWQPFTGIPSPDYYYSDLAVASSDWIGDFAVQYYKPNGTGNSAQFTPSAGSNYQTVDEATKDTSDYNASTTVGHKDTFAMENVVTPSVIKAVAPVILADRQDAGVATLNAVIRHSGTDYDQTAFSPNFGSITYNKPDYLETNPGTGLAWVDTDVNAMELGYKRAS
jgi:hypothetical protein